MEHVIVERTFAEAVELAKIEELKRKHAWCREQNRVRYIAGYVSAERKRMICVYEAPDAESVRRYNRQSGLPYDAVWTAAVVES
jgi:hypothetical protein